MRVSLSDKIRKLAAFIERDNTPSEVVIGDSRMVDEGNLGCLPGGVKKKKVRVPGEEKIAPTALPEQRRPREQPGHLNKWNDDTKTGLMKEYMQEYRADGKDKEVDGPKSTYKKKFKPTK